MPKPTKKKVDAPKRSSNQVRLAIIAADFNKSIVTPMIESAMKAAIELG